MTQLETPSLMSLIDWLKVNDYVYYHAPMDHAPAFIQIRQLVLRHAQPERCRVTFWTAATGCLEINLSEHLDRFRLPVGASQEATR